MNKGLELLRKYLELNQIESELKKVIPDHDFEKLEWTDLNGNKESVYQGDVLLNEKDEIEAYQTEKILLESLVILTSLIIIDNEKNISKWPLKIIDRDDERCSNLYLAKHGESIVHVYQNAGNISISSYLKGKVKNFDYQGELIRRKGNIIAVEKYHKMDNEYPVELIKIPELIFIKTISRKEAKENNLTPWNNKSKEELMTD